MSENGKCVGQNAGRVPLQWISRRTGGLIATQCVDAPTIDPKTKALIFPICWRRSCIVSDGSLDADDIDLLAPTVSLSVAPAFQQSSVGVALTLLRPGCAAEAWAEGYPVNSDKYNSLLFNEADTVTTPGGGLDSFAAHLLVPGNQPAVDRVTGELRTNRFCDDRSAVFMLNVMPVQLVDTVYNMCPKHAIPDKSNGNADCPAGKVMVYLDIVDGNWKKDNRVPTVKQCVDPANYDMFGGEMAISYCWSFGQLPDQFAVRPFRVRMPNVTQYNIGRMPGGSWDTRVNKPINRGVTVTLTVNPIKDKAISISETGFYTLPSSGIQSLDLEILVPVGLDDQSVSVQMFGPPNPPPPSELCPCPKDLPSDGICPGTTALMTASLVTNSSVIQKGCVPSPYWDGVKGELMFSHCWRYLCLDERFQKQDYYLDLEFTDKYNVHDVPAGTHRLDWFKPKIVDMFLRFKYYAQPNQDEYFEYSSRNGQSQNITIPEGGVKEMGVRFKIPYNMIYDTNSGSVNLNTDLSRLLPPPPPPLAIVNYSYTVNRTGSVLKSQIFVSDITSNLSVGAVQQFSSDIQGSLSGYLMTSDLTFPDYGLVKSCTPSDVQKVLDMVATKYGVSADSLSASCQYNYVKPGTASSAAARRRSLLQSTDTATVCKPRISVTVTLPLNLPNNSTVAEALTAATMAANAVYDAVGSEACYVPTGSESTIGTVVSFETDNPKATCEYLLQAFASANNLTTDLVRTFRCDQYNPPKPYPVGLIVLWTVLGVVGLVLIILAIILIITWRRRRARNLLFISNQPDEALFAKRPSSPGTPGGRMSPTSKVMPNDGDVFRFRACAVAEGLSRPDTPNRRLCKTSAVPMVAGNQVLPI